MSCTSAAYNHSNVPASSHNIANLPLSSLFGIVVLLFPAVLQVQDAWHWRLCLEYGHKAVTTLQLKFKATGRTTTEAGIVHGGESTYPVVP